MRGRLDRPLRGDRGARRRPSSWRSATWTRTPPRARRTRYGVPSFASHAELLAAMRPDVVHITTPHDQHVQPAIDALAAGVHVVVEKPVAHIPQRGGAAGGRGRATGCTQDRRLLPEPVQRDQPGDGRRCSRPVGSAPFSAGRPRSAGTARRRTTSPGRGAGQVDRSGGGVLINQAIHSVDLLQWLLGDVRDGARSGQPAGPRGRGRRGHRADRAGSRRRRPVGLLRHQRQRHRLTGHPGDRHRGRRAVPPSRPHGAVRRRSRRGRRGAAGRLQRSGLLGRLAQAA